MIDIFKDAIKVKGKFITSIGNGWSWAFTISTCQDEPYAIMLSERMQKDLSNKLESIRREAYNEGWKDAKSKKVAKRTWFKSWW